MPTVGLVSWLLLDSLAKIIPSEMFSVVFYCIIGQFRCYYSLPRGGANAGQHEKETHKRVKRKTTSSYQYPRNNILLAKSENVSFIARGKLQKKEK